MVRASFLLSCLQDSVSFFLALFVVSSQVRGLREMKILVTGGAGFIGSHLVEALLEHHDRISVIDDFNDFYDPLIKERNLEPVRTRINVHRLDIRNKQAVADAVSAEKPDAIVHLAARAGVRPVPSSLSRNAVMCR